MCAVLARKKRAHLELAGRPLGEDALLDRLVLNADLIGRDGVLSSLLRHHAGERRIHGRRRTESRGRAHGRAHGEARAGDIAGRKAEKGEQQEAREFHWCVLKL